LFNNIQKNIISLIIGRHIVLAAPGTGKTEILVQRILHALNQGVQPENMISLTFTNRAAKSMQNRVAKETSLDNIFIGNIHSFCLEFLKTNDVFKFGDILLNNRNDIFEKYKKSLILR